MSGLIRPPLLLALRPFVATLWSARSAPLPAAELEHVLPSGAMHVAIRLDGPPIRIVEGEGRDAIAIEHAVIGGIRDRYYAKAVDAGVETVGAQLRPGAARALFGHGAHEFAGRHVPLAALWGNRVARLRERLRAAENASSRLAVFETFLAARLPRVRGMHPAVAASLGGLSSGQTVREIVHSSGYSHRGFLRLFEDAVGLTPKRYARILRFQSALAGSASLQDIRWAGVATAAGYSDQAHFVREFRAMAGLTPTRYRRLAPPSPNHVRFVPGD